MSSWRRSPLATVVRPGEVRSAGLVVGRAFGRGLPLRIFSPRRLGELGHDHASDGTGIGTMRSPLREPSADRSSRGGPQSSRWVTFQPRQESARVAEGDFASWRSWPAVLFSAPLSFGGLRSEETSGNLEGTPSPITPSTGDLWSTERCLSTCGPMGSGIVEALGSGGTRRRCWRRWGHDVPRPTEVLEAARVVSHREADRILVGSVSGT